MKICPNCNTENEDSAVNCLLCEFEFKKNENYGNKNFIQNDALEQEDFFNMSAMADNSDDYEIQAVDHSDNISSEKNEPVLNQHNSKSSITAIIVISCILIAGSGIFGIMQSTRNKNEKNNDSRTDVMNSTSTETTPTTDEMITTSVESTETEETITTTFTTETTAITKTTTKETTAATKPEKPTVSSDEINRAAKQTLNDFMKNNAVQSPKYSLYDVNGDGVSELFVSYMAISGDTNYVLYYYDSSEFKELKEFWGGLSICPDNHYLKETNYGGAEVYKYYQLNEENQLSKFDEIYSSTDGKYYRNGQEISSSEYYAAIYYYNDMSWIDIYDNSYSFSDLIDVSAYVQNNTDSYDPYADIKQEILNSVDNEDYRGKNSHIENAPSDMVFYNYENRSSLSITNLTIYEGPDTNYPQICAYVSDAYIVGENNNWYYVQWYEGTGRFSHLCYGYLSKTGQSKKYTTYDTSAAGSDFSFFNEPYSRKVMTKNDPLNLRAAPSTSAEIIIKMPKGSPVTLYGSNSGGLFAGLDNNSGWSYISYTENGITYYGYASSEFIGLP